MNRQTFVLAAVMATSGLSAAGSAEAAPPFGAHPALRGAASAEPAGIDPNTFIVAHPAGLALRRGHANHEHPAIASARAVRALDPNAFLVQPPASVSWAPAPDASARVATLR